jgi:hypothetical protein
LSYVRIGWKGKNGATARTAITRAIEKGITGEKKMVLEIRINSIGRSVV